MTKAICPALPKQTRFHICTRTRNWQPIFYVSSKVQCSRYEIVWNSLIANACGILSSKICLVLSFFELANFCIVAFRTRTRRQILEAFTYCGVH